MGQFYGTTLQDLICYHHSLAQSFEWAHADCFTSSWHFAMLYFVEALRALDTVPVSAATGWMSCKVADKNTSFYSRTPYHTAYVMAGQPIMPSQIIV